MEDLFFFSAPQHAHTHTHTWHDCHFLSTFVIVVIANASISAQYRHCLRIS